MRAQGGGAAGGRDRGPAHGRGAPGRRSAARRDAGALEAETAALRAGRRCVPGAAATSLAVRGPDAEAYLQGQLSQDVAALAVGAVGGRAPARARREALGPAPGDPHRRAGLRARRRRRLRRSRSRHGCAASCCAPRSRWSTLAWRCLSLRGARRSGRRRRGCWPCWPSAACSRCPSSGTAGPGSTCSGPADVVLGPDAPELPGGVVACGPEAVEACRIASGIPAMGTELTGKTIAAEAGLVERTVSFTKGCYTGQELVARHRLPGLQRGPPPGRGGGARGPARGRPARAGHDAARRGGAAGRRRRRRQGGRDDHLGGLERRAGGLGGARVPAPDRRRRRARSGCARATASVARARLGWSCSRSSARADPERRTDGAPRRCLHRSTWTAGARARCLVGRRRLRAGRGRHDAVHHVGQRRDGAPDRRAGACSRLPAGPGIPGRSRRRCRPAAATPTGPGSPCSAAIVVWELAQYAARGSRGAHPTLSSMADAIDRHYLLKAVVVLRVALPGRADRRQGHPGRRPTASRPARRHDRRHLLRRVGAARARHCSASGPFPVRRTRRSPVPPSSWSAWRLVRCSAWPSWHGGCSRAGTSSPAETGRARRRQLDTAPTRDRAARIACGRKHRNCNRTSPNLRQPRRTLCSHDAARDGAGAADGRVRRAAARATSPGARSAGSSATAVRRHRAAG